jgi:hypothetical protein
MIDRLAAVVITGALFLTGAMAGGLFLWAYLEAN